MCVSQLVRFGNLSLGVRTQAAMALLSLLKGRQGEVATEQERSVISWVQACFETMVEVDYASSNRFNLPLGTSIWTRGESVTSSEQSVQ